MISVLVVDDHDLVRSGISRILADANGVEVIGEASSGEDAITQVRLHEPDVVLMDVQMPGIGGLEATRKIISSDLGSRVIAVTACDENPFARRLFDAGASGYLTKGADAEEMVTAIRKVHSGQRYISPEIAQRMALQSWDAKEENPFDRLSERELQVSLMIVNCQKVPDIADKLFLSSKTVNTHRYRVFEKLGINSDVELTHLAYLHGLVDRRNGG
ncbi:UvrY/SirA/GacA family response regulator transcription factor [Parathalassolituus penaei]|uniref:UvrY/SirA/GacA family response regulator transcription factor n=1 Tax=Parathalassolituus penaei TaxID=2997323 RepID=A0A9X3EAG6_9GAMM|nr:UvrY/SirA/GacA family response regulator transcription factor [Parathalassolituus penaei]MCY0963942.1 UvrY/SirA/GacA family response regulator transcription factor [Parathalassolituus penaei]